MSFGKIVKALRQNRYLTQEQLANAFNISAQAVSRWENDMALPDISLLPAIANFFDVTTDHLLEVDISKRQEKVKAIAKRADSYSSRGYLTEARTLLEDGLRQYPNSFELIDGLMHVASKQADVTGDAAFREESIRLAECIYDNCTVDTIRHSAIQVLCYEYAKNGQIEKARKLAESMPSMVVSRESLLCEIETGDRKQEIKLAEFDVSVQKILRYFIYANGKRDSGEWIYTPQEAATLRDKGIKLIELLHENGDYGFHFFALQQLNMQQAEYYAEVKNVARTLYYLKNAGDSAIGFDEYIRHEGTYAHTSLLWRGKSRFAVTMNDSDNMAKTTLDKMKEKRFDSIKNEPQYLATIQKLSEYAGKWEIN